MCIVGRIPLCLDVLEQGCEENILGATRHLGVSLWCK
jgi:hypothetical protein